MITMTVSPSTGAMKAPDTELPPNNRTVRPGRDRDWPLILGIMAFILTLFGIAVTGFFHLEGRIDGLGARIDGLYELILSLKS